MKAAISGGLAGLVSFAVVVWLAVAVAHYNPGTDSPIDPHPMWPSMQEWDR